MFGEMKNFNASNRKNICGCCQKKMKPCKCSPLPHEFCHECAKAQDRAITEAYFAGAAWGRYHMERDNLRKRK